MTHPSGYRAYLSNLRLPCDSHPYIWFLFVRSGVCVQLPPDLAYRQCPCMQLTVPATSVYLGLSPYRITPCLAHIKSQATILRHLGSSPLDLQYSAFPPLEKFELSINLMCFYYKISDIYMQTSCKVGWVYCGQVISVCYHFSQSCFRKLLCNKLHNFRQFISYLSKFRSQKRQIIIKYNSASDLRLSTFFQSLKPKNGSCFDLGLRYEFARLISS